MKMQKGSSLISAQSTVFTYHEVGCRSRYSVSTDQFAAHLELFSQLMQASSTIPKVTFDDGHVSNYTHAMPVLARRSVKATFFVTVGHIGVKRDFMDWSAVREIAKEGHAVQAHGWSHCFLDHCTEAQFHTELSHARLVLEDKLGRPVDELSLPGGRYDERVLDQIMKAGYHRVYSSEPWAYRRVSDSVELVGRLMVRRDMTINRMRALANKTATARSLVYAESAVRHLGRRLLGNETYHQIWSKLSGRDVAASSLTAPRN